MSMLRPPALNGVSSLLLLALCLALGPAPAAAQTTADAAKLDEVLLARAQQLRGRSRVMVEYHTAPDVRAITAHRGRLRRRLTNVNTYVADIDNYSLSALAADPRVARVMVDRPAFPTLFRTGTATGAAVARERHGLTGAGIGVVVIDSGVAPWHNDLAAEGRIAHFRDLTVEDGDPRASLASDDYGHGTHISSIIAGSGSDSSGARTGIAPGAHLVVLKVLDGDGQGYISDIIEAFQYAVAHKDALNIRVINVSVASGVFESYWRDPLTLAAKVAVDAGIVVVASAGNLGQNDEGQTQYGGITSPGNAPWVITVGAASHQGTAKRSDDRIGDFSSRGPTAIDFAAKPDIVAPGVGTEAAAAMPSTLGAVNADYLVGTPTTTGFKPYLSLSGTSMAAPVVTGAVALMLEANPSLTPNAVKALLQYTAQTQANVSPLAQGAGLLNIAGAVRLAEFFERPAAELSLEDEIAGEMAPWSRQIIWGNYRISGGFPLPGANAWDLSVTWGAQRFGRGNNSPIVWGARTADSDVPAEFDGESMVIPTGDRRNIVWATGDRRNIVWATGDRRNIVWATGDRRNIVWATGDRRNIVWATGDRRNIVWATGDRRNIVWATALGENIVWGGDCGGDDCQRRVWGTEQNGQVWGTASVTDHTLWPTGDRRNIVWATGDRRNIVWATGDRRNIVWATDGRRNIVWATGIEGEEAVWSADAPQRVLWPASAN